MNQTPRRYRGLHIVPTRHFQRVSQQLNRLAQTQAIVAQVEHEIAQRATRERIGSELMLLSPVTPPASLAARAAHRVVLSLFPAGL